MSERTVSYDLYCVGKFFYPIVENVFTMVYFNPTVEVQKFKDIKIIPRLAIKSTVEYVIKIGFFFHFSKVDTIQFIYFNMHVLTLTFIRSFHLVHFVTITNVLQRVIFTLQSTKRMRKRALSRYFSKLSTL